MKIAKPNMKKIDLMACVAVGVSVEMVYYVWQCAHRFNSFDLGFFMFIAPCDTTIWKAKRVLKLSKAF